MSNSKGESRTITRAKRELVARNIASCFDDEDKLALLEGAMNNDGASIVRDSRAGMDHRLQLLGRTATCTSSAAGAKWNWIRATLREFGLGQ